VVLLIGVYAYYGRGGSEFARVAGLIEALLGGFAPPPGWT
jgi:hypothetical protein